MDLSEVRKLSALGLNREIRGALISDKNRAIMQWIFEEGVVTSAAVASHFGISIQNASGSLDKMYRQGYLRRHGQDQASGGFEWVYFL